MRNYGNVLQARHPLHGQILHMPGGRYPNSQQMQGLQAVEKLNAAGLTVPQYLALSNIVGGDNIGVDSWPMEAVDRTFDELFDQIAEVTDYFKDLPRIDLTAVKPRLKRQCIKELFESHGEGGHRMTRPRRRELYDDDWYPSQRGHHRTVQRSKYRRIPPHKRRVFSQPPTSPLAYSSDPYSNPNYSYDPNLSYDEDDDDSTYASGPRESSEDDYMRYRHPRPRGGHIRRS